MKNENIVAGITIITSSIICFGILYMLSLYSEFNILISSYIDISEAFILFIPSLPFLILLLPLSISAFEALTPISIDTVPLSDHSLYGRLFGGILVKPKAVKLISITAFSIFFSALLVTRFIPDNNHRIYGLLLGLFLTFIIFYFPAVVRSVYDHLKSTNLKPPPYVPILTYFIILVFIGTLFAKDKEKYRILHSKRRPIVEVTFNNQSQITTDSVIRYIGKTKDFIFFYNIDQKEAIIYPNSEVVKMKFIDPIH